MTAIPELRARPPKIRSPSRTRVLPDGSVRTTGGPGNGSATTRPDSVSVGSGGFIAVPASLSAPQNRVIAVRRGHPFSFRDRYWIALAAATNRVLIDSGSAT
ncbi:hypothetical protein MFAL_35350 [Mycolicibacterium fallax]|nr:hypothetical protein MFAL_35350 [Mycolicibacterium fallax]